MFNAKYTCVCWINLIKSHAWYHTSLITFPNECLPCNKKTLLNLVPKMKFCTFLISPSGFLCIYYSGFRQNFIRFELYSAVEQFYNIATKVSSRKKCYYFCWSTWLFRFQNLRRFQDPFPNPNALSYVLRNYFQNLCPFYIYGWTKS